MISLAEHLFCMLMTLVEIEMRMEAMIFFVIESKIKLWFRGHGIFNIRAMK